ncbi:MAG: hypothetical protein ACOX1U_06705 [Saccharofermentanales bacterium]|jgi:hypothetical protein
MKLEGRVFRANLLLRQATVERPDSDASFVSQLEKCLIELCHELDVPIPLWLSKNTREFARFHQTLFFADQFNEKVRFDRFQIHWFA